MLEKQNEALEQRARIISLRDDFKRMRRPNRAFANEVDINPEAIILAIDSLEFGKEPSAVLNRCRNIINSCVIPEIEIGESEKDQLEYYAIISEIGRNTAIFMSMMKDQGSPDFDSIIADKKDKTLDISKLEKMLEDSNKALDRIEKEINSQWKKLNWAGIPLGAISKYSTLALEHIKSGEYINMSSLHGWVMKALQHAEAVLNYFSKKGVTIKDAIFKWTTTLTQKLVVATRVTLRVIEKVSPNLAGILPSQKEFQSGDSIDEEINKHDLESTIFGASLHARRRVFVRVFESRMKKKGYEFKDINKKTNIIFDNFEDIMSYRRIRTTGSIGFNTQHVGQVKSIAEMLDIDSNWAAGMFATLYI